MSGAADRDDLAAVADRAPCLGLGLVVAILMLATVLDDCACPAEAQIPARLAAGGAPARDWGPPADVLARALIAEADGSRADYAPLLAALQTRADRVGSTPARIAVRYCRVFRARSPTPRMVEILALPGTMPRARVTMWGRARAAVDRWLAGDHASGCERAPSHFGDRLGDARLALRMRWREVDCGRTANLYWVER